MTGEGEGGGGAGGRGAYTAQLYTYIGSSLTVQNVMLIFLISYTVKCTTAFWLRI